MILDPAMNPKLELHFGIIRWYKSTLHDTSGIGQFCYHAKKRDRTFGPMPAAGGSLRASQQSQRENSACKCSECRGSTGARCGAAPTPNRATTKFRNQRNNCNGRRRQSRGSRKQGGKAGSG